MAWSDAARRAAAEARRAVSRNAKIGRTGGSAKGSLWRKSMADYMSSRRREGAGLTQRYTEALNRSLRQAGRTRLSVSRGMTASQQSQFSGKKK